MTRKAEIKKIKWFQAFRVMTRRAERKDTKLSSFRLMTRKAESKRCKAFRNS